MPVPVKAIAVAPVFKQILTTTFAGKMASGLDPALSSERRNTSAMMGAWSAEESGWARELIMGTA